MSEIDKEAVGRRIKAIRLDLGESGETFGKRFDPIANRGLVSGWETGRYLPNNERLKLIAEIGGYDVEELLHGTLEEYVTTTIRHNPYSIELNSEQLKKVFQRVLDQVAFIETMEDLGRKGAFDLVGLLVHDEIRNIVFPIDKSDSSEIVDYEDREYDDSIDYIESLLMRLNFMKTEYESIAKNLNDENLSKVVSYLQEVIVKISSIEE